MYNLVVENVTSLVFKKIILRHNYIHLILILFNKILYNIKINIK